MTLGHLLEDPWLSVSVLRWERKGLSSFGSPRLCGIAAPLCAVTRSQTFCSCHSFPRLLLSMCFGPTSVAHACPLLSQELLRRSARSPLPDCPGAGATPPPCPTPPPPACVPHLGTESGFALHPLLFCLPSFPFVSVGLTKLFAHF